MSLSSDCIAKFKIGLSACTFISSLIVSAIVCAIACAIPQDVRQTATQFAGGKKAFYSKVDSYEGELEKKYKAVAYVFAYMASAYLE